MSQLFDSRAKVLEYEAKQRLVEKEIELAKLQAAPPRKPLPFNKQELADLDNALHLAYKLGWRSAEEAHGIKGEA